MLNIFKRKNPPRVISVCGHKIKVRLVKNLEVDGDDLLGAYNGDSKTIFIKKCPAVDWRSVLLHELCHSILHLTGATEGLTLQKEEVICSAFEHGLGPIVFK